VVLTRAKDHICFVLCTACCRFLTALFKINCNVDLCQEPDILLLVVDIMSYYKINVSCFADRENVLESKMQLLSYLTQKPNTCK